VIGTRGVPASVRTVAALAAVCLCALAATAGPAHACSCAGVDPRPALARADGAFIGRFVEKIAPANPSSSAAAAVYVFRLHEAVKGRFGSTVRVISALSGASCGLEVRRGQTIGLLLERRDGAWHSSLCQQVDPARLRAAGRPLPPPNGRGPAAVLVGGRYGTARSLALDARGRTLGYGRGPGKVASFGVCPGSRLAVELVSGRRAHVAVRALPRMRLVARRPLGLSGGGSFEPAVSCRSRGASEIAVFVTRPFRRGVGSRLLILRGRTRRTVWSGTALFGRIGVRDAYLAAGRRGDRLVRVDLATGRATTMARVRPTVGGVFLRPDGRAVALVSRTRVTVVPSRGGMTRARAVPCCGARVVWLARGRMAVLPTGALPRILDARLRPVGGLRDWFVSLAVARAGRLLGVGWDGRLLSAPDTGGRTRVVRFLPGTTTTAMAAVPPAR
jgi:hypothetical protein